MFSKSKLRIKTNICTLIRLKLLYLSLIKHLPNPTYYTGDNKYNILQSSIVGIKRAV